MFVLMIRMKMYHYTAMNQPIQKTNEGTALRVAGKGLPSANPYSVFVEVKKEKVRPRSYWGLDRKINVAMVGKILPWLFLRKKYLWPPFLSCYQ